ncbi:MAG: transcription-repair coupling factor [Chthoniobacterales bacterium]|nr:transcription-repair coupling factor [Chthoniobacterales bacterium]
MTRSNSTFCNLLKKAAASSGLAACVAALASSKKRSQSYALTQVTQAAWSFLTASVLASQKTPRAVWIICPDIKSQEHHFQELHSWLPEILFFPELSMTEKGLGLPDPEVLSERLAVLGKLNKKKNQTVLLTAHELSEQVPTKKDLTQNFWSIAVGHKASPTQLVEQLYEAGFARTSQVALRGELALRGGILDLFPWQSEHPCRLEFDEESIISIRTFDPDTQLSLQEITQCAIQHLAKEKKTVPFSDYISPEDLLIILGDRFEKEEEVLLEKIEAQKIRILEGAWHQAPSCYQLFSIPCHPIPFAEFGTGDFVMQEARRGAFFEQLQQWHDAHYDLFLFSSTEGEEERFAELLKEAKRDTKLVSMALGALAKGFSFPEAKLILLSDIEIFGRSLRQRWRRFQERQEQQRASCSALDFTEFLEGDFVVHLDYGIAHYRGVQELPSLEGSSSEVLVLEFEEESKLFVPLDQAWKVSRYVGVGKAVPTISSLHNDQWKKKKATAEKSIFLYAGKLLKLQAERETQLGYAFGPDTTWQRELENSFPYPETLDQLRAIAEIKKDMEAPQPMDRLLCGDVGFGKTEVALRAAFKALMDEKQVVFLAPTTVLAQQHYQTLRERMSAYPLRIELMSRYRSATEQRVIVQGLADGSVDLVIGTHRLFSPDIIFKNLGLVIVDEEQRFGVKHKEAFKERFRLIDMLTLSATPIPRTLYLSLMGARTMSLLETPPSHRQAVETIISAYDERLIRDVAKRELQRGGQVYFLHNRVESIEKVATRLKELLPEARIAWGHGQMEEKMLEEIMSQFVAGKIDILVATTIIESGLDIPNANTIIIDRADRFGLADLYQLRGRVGRSQQKAYAYLLLPRSLMLEGEARLRVQAIKQYSELGAGFKIAMRDLEIRGAGNLLGTAQSGHITAVGFDFYCKMLHAAVAQLRGETPNTTAAAHDVGLLLDFVSFSSSSWNQACRDHEKKEKETKKKFVPSVLPAFIPEHYLPEASLRIEAYRQLAAAPDQAALEQLATSWRDRFGPPPLPVQHLLLIETIRRTAAEHHITKVETRGPKLMLTRGGDYILLGHQFPRLTSLKPEAKLREVLELLQKNNKSA